MPSDQLDLFEPPTIMLAPCGREPGPCPAVIESGQYRCQRCGHIAPVTVSERDGGFFAAGIRFPTHAAAWEWLDDHNTEDRAAVIVTTEYVTRSPATAAHHRRIPAPSRIAPGGPGNHTEDTMTTEETKKTNLPTVAGDDGFDDTDISSRLIQGEILRCVDGRWSLKDDTAFPANTPLIAIATTEVAQHWKDGMPVQTIAKQPGKPLPDVNGLNEAIPQKEWEEGLDGEPRPPWVKQHVAYLINPVDASTYTFINSTTGARIAVEHLRDKVKMMRVLRGGKVVPVVELSAKSMKTKFGQKLRPDFKIIDWRNLGELQAPTAPPAIEQIGQPVKPVKPVTTKEEFNDEIPRLDAG
jgi:hypothetical protein